MSEEIVSRRWHRHPHIQIGQQFGRYAVVEKSANNRGKTMWLCRCDCGTFRIVSDNGLKSGTSRSCGCLRKDRHLQSMQTHGCAKRASTTRAYNVWEGMKRRCFNKNHKQFHDYGGRGITVCERWLKFENFLADMGEPASKMTLDRIDNSGNYEPGNCRWATRSDQQNNRRDNVLVTIGDETMTLTQWCRVFGISYSTMRARRRRYGWDIVRAITTPVNRIP